MRAAACAIDSSTNTYCYVEAADSTHASDLYLYQLPLGLALPAGAAPACTGCTRALMDTYAARGANASALADTYAGAAEAVNGACGAGYVADVVVGLSGAPRGVAGAAGNAVARLSRCGCSESRLNADLAGSGGASAFATCARTGRSATGPQARPVPGT